MLIEQRVHARKGLVQKAGQQRRIDEHRATAGKLHAAAARTLNLDAVVHLVQKETPVRPLGGQPLEEVAHLGNVHQLTRVVVVAVLHQTHLPPVEPSVFTRGGERLE